MKPMLSVMLLAALFASTSAAKMPSCEEDVASHCLGDDADMSPEGIEKVCTKCGAGRSKMLCKDDQYV